MELKVREYQLPEVIGFNFEELKTELLERTKYYETIVYTDDDIKAARSDRADLNKLKKALTDERIRREKEYMVPFNAFKDKINEIISIIDKPAAIIDQRIKEYEQQKKEEKKQQIREAFEKIGFPEYITLEKIWDDVWLNSTCSLSRIKEDFKTLAYKDQKAVEMLQELPEYSFEALEFYKKTLDVTAAMEKANEHAQIAKAKKAAEEEAARRAEFERIETEKKKREELNRSAQQTAEIINRAEAKEAAGVEAEAPGQWLRFEAYLTTEKAVMLRGFFEDNGIAFRPIR